MENNGLKFNMTWDITSKCNEDCKFCYRNKVKKDLSVEENRRILKSLYDSNIINKITICGGEPLMYQGLFELLESVEKPNDVSLSIVTNGIKLAKYDNQTKKFIIDKDLMNKTIKHFKWICFSIDSSNQDIENLVGRNKLHVERIRAILDYLKENNSDVCIKINSLVSEQNYNEIPNLYEFISKYKFIKRWKLFRYLGDNNSKEINDYYEINDLKFEEVKNFAKSIENENIKISINDIDTYNGTYIMLKQDGTVEISNDGELKEVLDLKVDDIRQINDIKEFNKEKHKKTHGVRF